MDKILTDEIPSYIKHSKVYKELVKQNIKCIYKNNTPLFKFVNKLTFDDFKEFLKTVYFWKINKESYPIEVFIYINDNLEMTKDYLKKYKNELTELLLQFNLNNDFLENVISKTNEPKGNLVLLNYIIDNGLKEINKLFMDLCSFGNLHVIEYLFKTQKIDIHFENDLALHIAAENGHLDVVKLLLDKGANIHADRDYALSISAENGHLDVVELLLGKGADMHAANDYALCCAAENGYLNIVKLLLDKGANIHADNDYSLRLAAKKEHYDVVELLLKHSLKIKNTYNKFMLLHFLKKNEDAQIRNAILNYINENLE